MASNDMVRILVSDHLGNQLGDIDPTGVAELDEAAQVNGEHTLTIVTTQELEKTNRLLVRDARGYWHEYVVLGIASEREDDGALWHEYYCVWSLQYDLSATFIDDMYGCGVRPGKSSVPQTARRGLECALAGTARWGIGAVTVTAQASASFYRMSGWEGLQRVVERWGGELRATIAVDSAGVLSRSVDLLEHEGRADAVRRFDYGHDVTGIKRTVSDDIWPCRIVPLGASQETEAGGYTRRPSIESVNGGVMWLEDADAVPLTRVPDGRGGWEYPTLVVKNDTYEQPADLLAWAQEHISDYTRPIVSYEAEVAQLTQAGMDAHGVGLGDEVAVVDRTFGEAGLRISARVLKIKQSLLDPSQTELTIGNLSPSLGGEFAGLQGQVTDLAQQVENAYAFGGSTEWVQNLLDRINDDINATGGYTYITEGQGIRTYDVAVSDPLVGAEASAVVEIKGGTVRIANTKDSGGQWEWKTVFTSGYVNAEVIRAIGMLSGSHVEVDANGVHIYDQNGVEVATYSSTATIGRSGQTRVEVDYSSLRLIDSGNHEYAYIGDERESDGYARFYETFTGDGSTTRFYLVGAIVGQTYELVEAYVSDGSGGSATLQGISVTFESAPSSGASIVVTYMTASRYAKTYKLGESTGYRGMMSFVEGYLTASPGWASHAEGYQTSAAAPRAHAEGNGGEANGDSSHAEGVTTWANGEGSHAEGYNSLASGNYSHAGGVGTIAAFEGQTAIGKYNATGNYAFLIGNGTYGNRSNAMTVDWDGSVMTRSKSHAGNESVSSNTAIHKIDSYDKDNQSIGYTQIVRTSSGIYRSFAVRNRDTGKAAALYVYSNDDGTMLLSLASGMTFDINRFPTVSRAHGGTGVTGRQSSSVTLSGCTAGDNHCWHNGVVATVAMSSIAVTAQLASGSSVVLGTVPSGYRPAVAVYCVMAKGTTAGEGKMHVRITSAGELRAYNYTGSAIAAGGSIGAFTLTYAI